MGLPTKRLSDEFHVKGESIVRHVCTRGSYFGVKPNKLPNGRLDWPDDAIERVRAYKPNKSSEKEAA